MSRIPNKEKETFTHLIMGSWLLVGIGVGIGTGSFGYGLAAFGLMILLSMFFFLSKL